MHCTACTARFYCTVRFKLNFISTLLSRAYRVCFTYSVLHDNLYFVNIIFNQMVKLSGGVGEATGTSI